MTDRELIEMAAKAAGIVGKWERRPEYIQERWYFNVPYDNQGMLTGFEWNPRADDGDCFRLAVKLKIDLRFPTDNDMYVDAGDCDAYTVYLTDTDNDRAAAARLAIVRAAAEIGKAMP